MASRTSLTLPGPAGIPVVDRPAVGACPSVAAPFAAADGPLTRVRLPGGVATARQVHVLAEQARRLGNGVIEITSRANLQVRGVLDPGALRSALLDAGLLHADDDADLRRNLFLSPTVGIDPDELVDVRPVAAELLRALEDGPPAGALPAKFGVLVDGSGRVNLGAQRADVTFRAVRHPDSGLVRFAAGTALTDTVLVAVEDAPAALRIAIQLVAAGGVVRPSDLSAIATVASVPAAAPGPGPVPTVTPPLGIQPHRDATHVFVGAAPVLGRLTPDQLAGLAELSERHGDGTVRFTPWRTVLLPGVPNRASGGDAERVEAALTALDLTCDPADPALRVVASAGSTGCTSGHADTQADGRRLVSELRAGPTGTATIHLSGCEKRCASRAIHDVTLLARPATDEPATDRPAERTGRYDALGATTDRQAEVAIDHDLAAADAIALAAGTRRAET